MPSFADAIAVRQIQPFEYEAHLRDEWCIGSVPHGGYVTSCFLQVANEHFRTTLSKQNQPHTIALHLEFVRRTSEGRATLTVRHVKIGRTTSTIHVTLSQNGHEEVLGYLTNSNISREQGPSFDTKWQLEPPPEPVDLRALRQGSEATWKPRQCMPFSDFRKASQHVQLYFPKDGQIQRGLADQWMTFRSGEKFTNASLGFVVDMFPQLTESYRSGTDPYSIEAEQKGIHTDAESKREGSATFWYPTLLLNLDIKKALPDEGVDILFLRTRAKQIKNGRFDLEIVVMDETGDIVALSHHVCMILSGSRNLAKRSERSLTDSKL